MATKQVTINGKTYHLGQLAHSKARETFFILLRNLGPGMGELIAQLASGGKLADLNLDPRALGRAIQDVCLRLNDADAAAVSEAFGSVTVVVAKGAKVELTPKAQERHFQGALGEWLEWLGHAVAWNYADFLELWTRVQGTPGVAPDSQKAVEAEE